MTTLKTVLDRELGDRSKDAFGHGDYADVLRHLLESPEHHPPYSVGLLGTWGAGKSTVKELYRASLEADDERGPGGRRRRERVHVVTYNAWRFGGNPDIKRDLLRQVFRALDGDEEVLRAKLFKQISETVSRSRDIKEWATEFGWQILLLLIGVMAFATFGFLALFAVLGSFGLDDAWRIGGAAVGFVPAAFLTAFAMRLLSTIPAATTPRTIVSFPANSAEEYEELLVKQIEAERKRRGRHWQRLVVFVDDLDRLSATEMVAGLDAIRNFLELPFAKDDAFGVVFVISCDEERVAEALKQPGGRLKQPDQPVAVFSRADARRYLDRMFQFRLEIPPLPKLDMRSYAEEKLRTSPEVVAGVAATNIEVRDLADRLIHVGVQSPRNAIQLVNAFLQSWWIAAKREASGPSSGRPGGLYAGAVTQHPLSLAAICVLRVDFPDFFGALQKRPQLIEEFQHLVVDKRPAEDLAPAAIEALSDFVVRDKDGKLTADVKAEHRGLRQYLSSIRDLRLAKPLQPLLLLAVDPLNRQLGARAAELNDHFVSGDLDGVLDALGRRLDDLPLRDEDVLLLKQLAEGLSTETEARRVSAARVLGALAHRIPRRLRREVLTPLGRQMAEIKQVRTNIGVAGAVVVCEDLLPEDRTRVVARFAEDLLSLEPLDWRLRNGQEPSLDELVEDVRATAHLAVSTLKAVGLDEPTKAILRSWLLARRVRDRHGSDQVLDPTVLFSLVDEAEAPLLQLLGAEFSAEAIAMMEQGGELDEATLRRVRDVIEGLDVGQESRALMWEQLIRLVEVDAEDGCRPAWEIATAKATTASPDERRAFHAALGKRLARDMEETAIRSWKEGLEAFVALTAAWRADVVPECNEDTLALLQAIAATEEAERFVDRIETAVGEAGDQLFNELDKKLLPLAMAKLPDGSVERLGRRAAKMTPENQAALARLLSGVVGQNPVPPDQSARHKLVLRAAGPDPFATGPLRSHLDKVFAEIRQRVTSEEAVRELLPAAIVLFPAAGPNVVRDFLRELFQNSYGTPAAFVAAHRAMAGHWSLTDDVGDLDRGQIVSQGADFIATNNTGSADVFSSITELARIGPEAEAHRSTVAAKVPLVWRRAPGALMARIADLSDVVAPATLAEILRGPLPAEREQADLVDLSTKVLASAPFERRRELVVAVLSQPPADREGEPDAGLSAVVDATGSGRHELVIHLLSSAEVSDEQRQRLVAYALRRRGGIPFAAWPAILDAAAETSSGSVLGLATDLLQAVLGSADTAEKRSRLAASAVKLLPRVPEDRVAEVAKSIGRLGGQGLVDSSEDLLAGASKARLEVLAREFPRSRALKRALRSAEE